VRGGDVGKPFRVRSDLMADDSSVAVAIVRTPTATVDALMYDSDPSGGGNMGDGVVYPQRYPEPIHFWIYPSGRISCFQNEASPPRSRCPR
jgi:hypothetical protein